MRTLVNNENIYLSNGHHILTDAYEVGELRTDRVSAIRAEGFSVKGNQLMGRFDGVRTFVDFLSEKGGKFGSRRPMSDDSSHDKSRSSDWTKYKTYEECIKTVKEQPERFRNFQEADIRLTEYESNGNDVDFGTTGDFVDIGRVMEGEPECFGTMRNGNVIKRFANIVVNGNHAHWINCSWIDAKAQRTARLVDFLEASNVRVRVTILYTNDNSHLELVIKQYNDRLDINDICVALSPDFFRRFEFYWSEHSRTHDSCYGRAETIHMGMVREDDVDLNVLVGSDGHANVERDFDNLEKQIEENGVNEPRDYNVVI